MVPEVPQEKIDSLRKTFLRELEEKGEDGESFSIKPPVAFMCYFSSTSC